MNICFQEALWKNCWIMDELCENARQIPEVYNLDSD